MLWGETKQGREIGGTPEGQGGPILKEVREGIPEKGTFEQA